ncbi:MAG TPA: hypothetical protein VGG19_15330 [Tepidisphaeraceae bacterium]|jgi:hypothetical protein
MSDTFEYNAPDLDRLQMPALLIGLLGIAACIIGYFAFTRDNHVVAFQAYLVGFIFWWCITIGLFGMLMMQHMVSGKWGLASQRIFESGSALMWLMLLFFLPVVFGMKSLYNWTDPVVAKQIHTTWFNTFWLNPETWIIRAVIYFAIWIVMIFFLRRWSLRQDREANPRIRSWMRTLSGPGLVIFGFTSSFAVYDWVMSLDPRWYSTIYGFIFIAGQGLAALAIATIALAYLARYKPFNKIANIGVFHDMGNLMMAFVILWAYMSFSQLLISWSGNGREDANYYWHRGMSALNFTGNYNANTTGGNYVVPANGIHYNPGGWEFFAGLLILIHFFIPLALLVSRYNKRSVRALVWISLLILVARVADVYWNIIPMFSQRQTNFTNPIAFSINWMDIVAPIAIGGIWVFFFIGGLKRRPIVAINDPRLPDVLSDHAHH